MAARTCLLCGKALSRRWADKGEEFCSSEHRNQYRLRRGMDRLLEANAVASVMRRREIPKQIPAGELRSLGPSSPRGFVEAIRRPPAEVSIPAMRPAGQPRLNKASRYRIMQPMAEEAAKSRELPEAKRFPGPPARAPRIATNITAHVAPAPPATERPRDTGRRERRAPFIRWKGSGRPEIAALLARGTGKSAAALPELRPARRLEAASAGRALRVSAAAGFRLPERAAPATRFARPEVQGLPTPDIRKTTAAAPPRELPRNVLTIEIAPAAMRIPPPPGADHGRRFRWPGAFDIHLEFRNAANAARPMSVPFGPPEDSVKERR